MNPLTADEMACVAKEIAHQLHGSRIKNGDWPGDKEPGGNECGYCGGIFIGDEWRSECRRCSNFKRAGGDK